MRMSDFTCSEEGCSVFRRPSVQVPPARPPVQAPLAASPKEDFASVQAAPAASPKDEFTSVQAAPVKEPLKEEASTPEPTATRSTFLSQHRYIAAGVVAVAAGAVLATHMMAGMGTRP